MNEPFVTLVGFGNSPEQALGDCRRLCAEWMIETPRTFMADDTIFEIARDPVDGLWECKSKIPVV